MAKHESVESFAARFCELNKVSVKQFYDYVSATIQHAWRPGFLLSDEQIAKLAAALQEPQEIVDSVLCPYSGDADPFAQYCGNRRHQDLIKYCPSCASEGYHSHFHTFYWLERCPFDGAELLTHSCSVRRDGLPNLVEALAEILRARWHRWPGGVPVITINRRHLSPLFMSFQRWMLDTNMVTRNLIEMKSAQRRNDHWVEESNCANRVYEIRALLPPPEEIQTCYSEAVPTALSLLPLSAKDSTELRELTNKFEFCELVWFYRICRNSDPAGSVLRDALDSDLETLRLHHTPCRCRWGHSRSEGWRRVHPDEWPHWDLKCPNEVACDVLEAHYGDFRNGQSPRAADKEFFRYIECVEKYASAGLARHHGAPGDTLPEVLQQCVGSWQPWVEWAGPLGELFDAVLDAGRASDGTWLRRWLNDVEIGAAPQASPFPYPGVGLLRHEAGLALLAWNAMQPAAGEVNVVARRRGE